MLAHQPSQTLHRSKSNAQGGVQPAGTSRSGRVTSSIAKQPAIPSTVLWCAHRANPSTGRLAHPWKPVSAMTSAKSVCTPMTRPPIPRERFTLRPTRWAIAWCSIAGTIALSARHRRRGSTSGPRTDARRAATGQHASRFPAKESSIYPCTASYGLAEAPPSRTPPLQVFLQSAAP